MSRNNIEVVKIRLYLNLGFTLIVSPFLLSRVILKSMDKFSE
ncbi:MULTISPECIES: hypothetical protein [Clostridium]|uniref:Uncharacterized protein n=1 Tax=Clostridium frigoriphilum TaxID=443253 RepID=A0ABU7UX73_9CLOT|nr:hypothetical protein [Clostridium sp. DSM 17811]